MLTNQVDAFVLRLTLRMLRNGSAPNIRTLDNIFSIIHDVQSIQFVPCISLEVLAPVHFIEVESTLKRYCFCMIMC